VLFNHIKNPTDFFSCLGAFLVSYCNHRALLEHWLTSQAFNRLNSSRRTLRGQLIIKLPAPAPLCSILRARLDVEAHTFFGCESSYCEGSESSKWLQLLVADEQSPGAFKPGCSFTLSCKKSIRLRCVEDEKCWCSYC
jgi:hypothetical protein